MIAIDTAARGTNVFVAIMVAMAPRGHSAAMSFQPKPESVPG